MNPAHTLHRLPTFCRRQHRAVQGNINIIEAAAKKGVKKFILVTSIGTGDSKDAPPGQVYDVLKPVLLEKEKAEEALKVRPRYLRPLPFDTIASPTLHPENLHPRNTSLKESCVRTAL